MSEPRNFDDPRYKRWRKAVFARDRRCRFPGCSQTRGLNAHHIRRWADHPGLRFVVSNGVALCRQHHAFVSGREEAYEEMFLRAAASRDRGTPPAGAADLRVRILMEKYAPQEDDPDNLPC